MQKLLRFAAAVIAVHGLLTAAPAQAQTTTFANGNFETWSNRNATQAPDNWLTTDDIFGQFLPIPFSFGSVTRTTDSHGGAYAVKLETVTMPGRGDTIPGALMLGTQLEAFRLGLPGGIPFTSRPQELQFYYKLTGAHAADDSAQVLVTLTRFVNGAIEPIAVGEPLVLAPAATYTLATVPLTYISSDAPDSLQIAFTNTVVNLPHPGTALYIDDVSLRGTALATRTKVASDLRIYPNPSTSGIFELSTAEAALLTAPLSVCDATGRVVLREDKARATANRRIDLSGRPAGIYSLQLSTSKGVVTRKLVVQ
ncbi:T9SS type A sorting domain-containing protein [Hymenobacter sp. ASUV-10]|uniref:T9SS type A sorting domain-containing protein n=1 Tax=Hymenobacter aranciens TaxID=3063996 RepID=A0ABT9BFZ2_9BACT|nr:T9SS type A sorting domain-containing protein [Hymenobacter sp. ASUV-10]MDO7877172.1 T9SS type A sorting domain-containing protein [Hymenobacter sp. ASUV-10]